MKILVTGGAGYIGSHTCVLLLEAGYEVVVCDSLVNSNAESLARVKKITGRDLAFYKGDLCDKKIVKALFDKYEIGACIHFAGLKAVGESVRQPLRYYENNIGCTLNLLDEMSARGIKKFIFSSSATVYGKAEKLPLTEDCPLSAENPYGRTKLFIEEILRDLYAADKTFGITILRYFNPIGAHQSGLIGEDPKGIPNNLMPYIAQVAAGRLKQLSVFGGDYPTPDGTGVRDYIHVTDLAAGHLAALKKIKGGGLSTYNLGTGNGVSVLEAVKAFEKASGKKIPYVITDRRPGDIAACYASCDKAFKELGWKARHGIDKMCYDHWNWQRNNPNGYSD